MWANRYDGPGHRTDTAKAIVVSPDGETVFVTGSSVGKTTGSDYATEAINASTGATVWTRRYNGSGDGADQACCVAVSPDGKTVYVTGASVATGHGQDYVTIAYNALTGATVWTSRYDGPGHGDDAAAGMVVSADGTSLYVTGSSYGGAATGADYATESLSSSTGARRWVRRYNGTAGGNDAATALALAPDGSRLFVTGSSAVASQGLDSGHARVRPRNRCDRVARRSRRNGS